MIMFKKKKEYQEWIESKDYKRLRELESAHSKVYRNLFSCVQKIIIAQQTISIYLPDSPEHNFEKEKIKKLQIELRNLIAGYDEIRNEICDLLKTTKDEVIKAHNAPLTSDKIIESFVKRLILDK